MSDDNVRQLAEKIYYISKHEMESTVGIEWIESLLREAMANEFAAGSLDQQRRCAKHCEEQRQQAYTRAAEVVKSFNMGDDEAAEIAAAIERLKVEK